MRHFLVLASGFASTEFQPDFGEAYSGLIPIYGEPVLRTVLREVPDGSGVTVTIPAGCEVARHVASSHPGVQIAEVSPSASLAEAAFSGLSAIVSLDPSEVVICFADTVAHGRLARDTVGAHHVREGHPYTLVRSDADGRLKFSPKCSSGSEGLACVGVFSIADPHLLIGCLDVPRPPHCADRSSVPGAVADSGFFAAMTRYSERRPMRIEIVGDWEDAGHRSTWTGLRKRRFEARGFNTLCITDDGYVEKRSHRIDKLSQEFGWFAAVPPAVAAHCPQVLAGDADTGAYLIEYLPSPTLGERMLWGRHDRNEVERALEPCASLLQLMQSVACSMSLNEQRSMRGHFYIDGTRKRLDLLRAQPVGRCVDGGFEVNGERVGSLLEVVDDMASVLTAAGVFDIDSWSTMHGDYFLGNLICDSRDGILKMIDPRGSFVDPGPWGDPLYDVGKLSHSLLGAYDAVATGLFTLDQSAPDQFDVSIMKFADRDHCASIGHDIVSDLAERLGLRVAAVRAVEALIFLRMLPLHAESPIRQLALIARALDARSAALAGEGA